MSYGLATSQLVNAIAVNAKNNKAYMTNLMVENREEVIFHSSIDLTEENAKANNLVVGIYVQSV